MLDVNPYFICTISKIKKNKINCHVFYSGEDDEYTISLIKNEIKYKKIHLDFGCDIEESEYTEYDISRLKEHLKLKYIKYCDEINEYKEEMVDQPEKYQNAFIESISDLELNKKVLYLIITNSEFKIENNELTIINQTMYDNWVKIMDVISI